MQEYSENYLEMYTPAVNWTSVRLILTFTILNNIHTRSIDFALAFPQADTDVDNFIELPICVNVPNGVKRKKICASFTKKSLRIETSIEKIFRVLM